MVIVKCPWFPRKHGFRWISVVSSPNRGWCYTRRSLIFDGSRLRDVGHGYTWTGILSYFKTSWFRNGFSPEKKITKYSTDSWRETSFLVHPQKWLAALLFPFTFPSLFLPFPLPSSLVLCFFPTWFSSPTALYFPPPLLEGGKATLYTLAFGLIDSVTVLLCDRDAPYRRRPGNLK